jgi:hypothetical protein
MQKSLQRLQFVLIKAIEGNLQKWITWPKTLGKGRQEWEKAGPNLGLPPRKLNTLMNIRFFCLHFFFNFCHA